MNATRKTMVPLATVLMFSLIGVGCSGDDGSRQAPVSAEPLVTAPPVPEDEPSVSAEINAGGIPSTYTAHYKDSELRRITEQRSANASGEYEFRGARLLRYRGAPLEGEGALILELDMHGAVLSARKNGESASAAEIDAIRNRASLLRSHALAQHATKAHAVH